MKRFLLAVLVVGLGAAFASATQTKADTKFHMPVSDNGVLPPSIDFFGVDVSTIADGSVAPNQTSPVRTTAKRWFVGEGVFYDLIAGMGSGNVFCFDSATVSDTTSETTSLNLVATVQRSATEAVSFGGAVCSGRCPPIRIHAGLVCDSANDSIYWPVFSPK